MPGIQLPCCACIAVSCGKCILKHVYACENLLFDVASVYSKVFVSVTGVLGLEL